MKGLEKFSDALENFCLLVKCRISAMNTLSFVSGMVLAGGTQGILEASAGIFFIAGSSSVLNNILDRDIDLLMSRTRRRPTAKGRIKVRQALALSFAMLVFGSLLLAFRSIPSLAVALLSFVIYVFVYTPLKRITPLAIVPGSLVGALVPVSGWFAGSTLPPSPEVLLLSLYLFVWQIPHFLFLSILYFEDYKKAGIPTLTSIIGERASFAVSVALLAVCTGLVFVLLLHSNVAFATALLLVSLAFLLLMIAVSVQKDIKSSSKIFFVGSNQITLVVLLAVIGAKVL